MTYLAKILLILGGFFLVTPDAVAQPDLKIRGKILFVTNRDGNDEIYVMNQDGSSQTNLSSNAASDTHATWGPRGRNVMFVSDRDGNSEIYRMHDDGSDQTRLTNDAAVDLEPHWSPNGSSVAFHTNRDGNFEIYVMDPDGSNPVRLTTDGADDKHPRWSPDGTQILFQSMRDGDWEIYKMDADGMNQTRLTVDGGADEFAEWSPDGSAIGWSTDRDGNTEIYRMNPDGSGPTRLTNDAGNDVEPSWSPDGTKLTWKTDRDANNEVYVMAKDGTGATNLSSNANSDADPSWLQVRGMGKTIVGYPQLRSIKLKNGGGATLNVSSITSSNGDFSIAPTSFAVTAGMEKILLLSFDPGSAGAGSTTLTITSDDPDDATVLMIVHAVAADEPEFLIGEDIVFTTDRDGNDEIYHVAADGSGLLRLTNHAGADQWPSWSPGGYRVAFQTDRDGNFEIYGVDADGMNLDRLTNDAGFDGEPAWSPDGEMIAFTTDRDGNNEIYAMFWDGVGLTRLTTDGAADQHPRWSPDGTKIVFQSMRDGNWEIYTMDPDGMNQTRLTTDAGSDELPQFSPDGGQIAFAADRDGNPEIYVMDSNGSNQTRVTHHGANDSAPTWSPEGTRIAFTTDRLGDDEIFAVDTDGGKPRRLTTDGAVDKHSDWAPVRLVGVTPVGVAVTRDFDLWNPGNATLNVSTITTSDGQMTVSPTSLTVAPMAVETVSLTFTPSGPGILFASVTITTDDPLTPTATLSITGNGFIPDPDLLIVTDLAFVTDRDGNDEIYTLDLENPATETRLTNDAGADQDPQVGPDGGKIVFATNRDGNFEIYSMNADGTSQTRLTTDAGVDGLPAWSPTGQQIVFQTDRDGNDEIYVMDADGMNPTRLTTDAAADQHPRWSPDGSLIVFHSLRDGNPEVYTMEPDGMNKTRLTTNAAEDEKPIWSPDGGRIAFVTDRDGNDEIYSMAADGTVQTRLTNDAGIDQSPSWSPDGTKIVWETDRDGNTNVYIADFDGVNPFPFTDNAGADGAPHWGAWYRVDESPVGVSVARNLRIFNPGSGTLNISSITSADGQFTFSPSSFSVNAGTGQDVTVTFSPVVTNETFSTFTLTSNDTKDPTLSFLGNGTGLASGGPPIIQASLTQLNIDSTAVGTTDTVFVAIRNVGSGLLNLSDITAIDPFGAFPPAPQSVLVGDSLVVGVTFTPIEVGGTTGGVVITHDDGAAVNPLTIPIAGFATDVDLILGVLELDFGDVRVGSQKQLFVGFETLGTDTLRITNTALVDSVFTASPESLVVERSPNNHGAISVIFAPDSVGAFIDTLSIIHNGSSSPTQVPVTGMGTPPPEPQASLSDSVFVLPDLQVGETFILALSLANPGDDTLRVHSVSSSSPIVEAVTDSLVIVPGGESQIELIVVPPDTGAYNAELVVTHNAVSSPDTLLLEGVAGLRKVTLLPDLLVFGGVEPGFPVTLSLRLQNDSPIAFNVADFVLDGPGFEVDGVPETLEPGSGADVWITFDPDGPGIFAGTLALEHDDPYVAPLIAQFSGEGVGASFQTTQRELVFVNPGAGGEVRDTLIIENHSDVALVLTPEPPSARFRVDPDTLIVEPGGTGTLLVVFVSDGPGKQVEDLRITHDAAGRPDLIIPLLVVAGHPDLVLADVEIDFGTVAVGDTVTNSTQIDNPGSDTLFVLVAPFPEDVPFLIQPLEFAVPPDGSTVFTVTFSPSHPGPRAEGVVVESNAGQGGPDRPPPLVTLVGTGVGPDLQLHPEVLTFGSLEVGLRDTQAVTIRNSGNDTLRLGDPERSDTTFSVGSFSQELLPGDEQELSVFYSPPDVEPRSDTLWVTTNVLGRERVPVLLQALEVPRNLGVSTVELVRVDTLVMPEAGDTVIVDVIVNPEGVSVEGADLFIRLDPRFFAPLTEQTPFERLGATESAIVLINDYSDADGLLSLSASLFNPIASTGVLVRVSLVVQATLGDRTVVTVVNEFPARNSQYLSSGSPFTLRPLGELTFGNQPPRLQIFPLLEAEEDGSASIALNELAADPDTPFDELIWDFETGDSLFAVGLSPLGNNLIARFFPPPDVFGTFRVATIVRDPSGGTDTTDVVVKVSPINDSPIAGTDTLMLRGGSRVVIPVLQLVTDIDGDDVHLVNAVAGTGVANVNDDGVVDYTTPDAFEGEDTIT